jgi:hypothetical protein
LRSFLLLLLFICLDHLSSQNLSNYKPLHGIGIYVAQTLKNKTK